MIPPVVFSIIVSTLRPLGSVPLALQLSFLIGIAFAVKSKAEIWLAYAYVLKNENKMHRIKLIKIPAAPVC